MPEKKTSRKSAITETVRPAATATACRPTGTNGTNGATRTAPSSASAHHTRPASRLALRVVSFVTIDFEGAAGDWIRADMQDGGGYFYEHRGEGTPAIRLGLADGRTIENRSGRVLVHGSAAHFWHRDD